MMCQQLYNIGYILDIMCWSYLYEVMTLESNMYSNTQILGCHLNHIQHRNGVFSEICEPKDHGSGVR